MKEDYGMRFGASSYRQAANKIRCSKRAAGEVLRMQGDSLLEQFWGVAVRKDLRVSREIIRRYHQYGSVHRC